MNFERRGRKRMHDFRDSAVERLQRLTQELPFVSDDIADLIHKLRQPPRIVVVGRLKAGKSTLVNALIGLPVAETAALEATNVVTVYQEGAPDRARATLMSGEEVPIETHRGAIASLPMPARDIAFVERWMTSETLRSYSLVDTPGLATLTEEYESATRGALLGGAEETRRAAVGADGAVFLFDAVPREDEVEFIRNLGLIPLNVVGVLSRADSFEEGALGEADPMAAASAYAGQLEAQLASCVCTVVPVSGLLAQTAATGEVTEDFARAFAEVAAVGRSELLQALLRPSAESADLAVKAGEVIAKVGEYGVFRCPAIVHQAVALNAWLTESSGIDALRRVIDNQLVPQAVYRRYDYVMGELEELAYRHQSAQGAIRGAIRDIASLDGALWPNLYRAYVSLQDSPASFDFVEEVERLTRGDSMAEKIGLGRYATGWEILDQVGQRRAWLQSYASGTIDPAEENVLSLLYQAYGRIESYGESLT